MNFFKTSFYSGVSTSIDLITKLVTNKIVAVFLGTNGMFLLGQLKDFISITKEFSSLGISNGIVKYSANNKNNNSILKNFLSTGFKIHLYCSLVIAIILILFRTKLSYFLFNSSQYAAFLAILSLSFISISLHTFILSILNGIGNIKLYTVINIISSILSALILVILTLTFDLNGTFYAFVVNQFLVFLISISFIFVLKPFQLNHLKSSFNLIAFKKLLRFSIMSIIATLCMIGSSLFVRYFISIELSSDYAGSWEGMWRISAIYLLFLTTTFKFYLIPTFSNLEGHNLKKEIFKIWKLIFPIIFFVTILIFLIKNQIIKLLFSEKFLAINTIIVFHLLGDIIKINCWVLGNVIISKAKTKIFALFQIEWALVFSILTYFLTKKFGFIGVGYAYFFAYLIHFILLNLNFRTLLWSKKIMSN